MHLALKQIRGGFKKAEAKLGQQVASLQAELANLRVEMRTGPPTALSCVRTDDKNRDG